MNPCTRFFLRVTLCALPLTLLSPEALPCTSAIVSARASASGRPMLWKNRDTSQEDNKVAYVPATPEGELAYVALFNASDRNCREAWAGMNSAGFAIMNTASYNLKADAVPAKDMDKEGVLMTLALKHCHTIADFEQLLSTLPRPMGVEANFGVIDAAGAGAYFETDNYSFTRYDLADEPSGVIVRTNYSHSGRPGEGYGQIREQNALHLLRPYLGSPSLTPAVFTEELSCSFYHSLLGRDMMAEPADWIIDQDFIPRDTTTASVVIEGVIPQQEPRADAGLDYVMWTALGYPPCAEVMPAMCAPDGVDPELQGLEEGGTSALCNRAKARKAEVFSAPDGNRNRYVNTASLRGANGYLPTLRRQNRQTYEKFSRR